MRKIRAKKKEEKEKTEKRMGELRRENEEIEQRTAVHAQVHLLNCGQSEGAFSYNAMYFNAMISACYILLTDPV